MVGRGRQAGGIHSRGAHGLTLLDLVLTLFILGILVAAIAPRFNSSLQRHRCDASARRLVADLQRARQHALASSTAVSVTFDLMTETYSFPSSITNPDRPREQYIVSLSKEPWLTEFRSVERDGSSRLTGIIAVKFLGSGACDADYSIVMASAGRTRTIRVSSNTGHAELQSSAPGQ